MSDKWWPADEYTTTRAVCSPAASASSGYRWLTRAKCARWVLEVYATDHGCAGHGAQRGHGNVKAPSRNDDIGSSGGKTHGGLPTESGVAACDESGPAVQVDARHHVFGGALGGESGAHRPLWDDCHDADARS